MLTLHAPLLVGYGTLSWDSSSSVSQCAAIRTPQAKLTESFLIPTFVRYSQLALAVIDCEPRGSARLNRASSASGALLVTGLLSALDAQE